MYGDRRYPIGLELLSDGHAHVRVWAPRCKRVDLVLVGDNGAELSQTPLEREEGGYFAGEASDFSEGSLYRFRLDGRKSIPDPASRFQPQGPHGPSQAIDPSGFRWTDADCRGIGRRGQVLYELHVGTFTAEGTFRSAIERLASLADIGVTTIEIMPIAEFPGRFGWGYDGVDLFAPTRLYGRPDDLRAFVDAAHASGLGVILDVVYNHLGPDGCYLREFSDWYFSSRHKTEWGDALNFDDEHSAPVREYVVSNAAYWIDEFHLDGLRLDATQQIFDDSPVHVIADITGAVRAAGAGRSTLVIAENEPQRTMLIRDRESGGYGVDALWNDDFHHSAHVALTGRDEAYYSGYRGSAQEFVSAAKYGYLYQGEWYEWQHQRRGTPALVVDADRFVQFIDNHDQVANSGSGARAHQTTSPGRFRAMTALLLLLPQTPMLFMGQEFAASAPFLYFADHRSDLAELVRKGRTEFLMQFANLATAEGQARLSDPADLATFQRCKLDWRERESHRETVLLHRDLLALRRHDPVLCSAACDLDGCVVNEHAFAMRWFGAAGDRLLVINLGANLKLNPWPEPLIAPPADQRWMCGWSSDDTRYGGDGMPAAEGAAGGWHLPAETAALFIPSAR